MEVEVEENCASAGRGCVVQGGEGGSEMEVEDGEDGASAGRVEGGTPIADTRITIVIRPFSFCILYSVIVLRGNGVIHRGQKPASRG